MSRDKLRETPDYGFDGSPTRLPLICLGAWGLGLALLLSSNTGLKVFGVAAVLFACLFTFITAKLYFYVRFGKLRLLQRLLSMANLTGGETVLDVGTGRGLLMIGAAKRLSSGKSIGIDIWNQADMKNNNPEDTLRNAAIEGVLGRVEVRSEDVQKLSFSDATFDVVLSNLCLHNIPTAAGRERACREIARVLKPGGSVVIADVFHLNQYARVFREVGMNVSVQSAQFLEAATPWHRILIGN